MNHFKEFKSAVIRSSVAEHGVRQFIVEIDDTTHETIKVRIAANDNTKIFEEKVNSLVDKSVDIVIYLVSWQFEEQSGILNYLKSIEESKN